jgi:hypothetical protein
MNESTIFVIGLVAFFFFITLIFLAIALLYPEWVGITGKKAKQILKEHQGDQNT